MCDSMPLSLLRAGEIADVFELIGPIEEVRRLEELGLRGGARVEIVRGGSSCIIRIGGSTLCVRNDSRVNVLVSPRKTA